MKIQKCLKCNVFICTTSPISRTSQESVVFISTMQSTMILISGQGKLQIHLFKNQTLHTLSLTYPQIGIQGQCHSRINSICTNWTAIYTVYDIYNMQIFELGIEYSLPILLLFTFSISKSIFTKKNHLSKSIVLYQRNW